MQPLKHSESMRLGVVLERRRIDHPWADHSWRPVAVIPGAPEIDGFRLLQGGKGWAQYHAVTLTVQLFRRETEGYRYNLSQRAPVVYVVLRRDGVVFEDAPQPFHVTVCPYEAQHYSESADDLVETVPMPAEVAAWVQDYVDRHHVDQPFHKRKRRPAHPGAGGPGAGGAFHG